jgi:N-carbamoylputrescine amidase
MFMHDLLVAAVCMRSDPGEVDKNLDRMESFVREAASKSAHAVLFPELSISGYSLKQVRKLYDREQSRKIQDQIVRAAQGAKITVMAGMVEMLDVGPPYITHVIAGPKGLIGLYRKTHLSPPEKEKYREGDSLDIFREKDLAFGLQLCYESHFPEISTVLSLKGAEIIFMPHASPRGTPQEKMKSWLRHLPARAFDNGVFVVACNQVGRTKEGLSFPGVVIALDPQGRVIESHAGDEEKMVFVELKAETLKGTRAHRMKYFLPHRKNELYRDLVS